MREVAIGYKYKAQLIPLFCPQACNYLIIRGGLLSASESKLLLEGSNLLLEGSNLLLEGRKRLHGE